MADAQEGRRQALVEVLAADPGLRLITPAATVPEILTTAGRADVIVLNGQLHDARDPIEVLRRVRLSEGGPSWVVLTHDLSTTAEVLAAGANGCLSASSTPVQISAAILAAARGEHAEPDHGVTGPLVQRVHREAPPLTEREVEILLLVELGLANREIAEGLHLSTASVKSHLSHTYGRLGVRRRAAAVAEARRQDLI